MPDTPQKIVDDVFRACAHNAAMMLGPDQFTVLDQAPVRIQALIDAQAALLDQYEAALRAIAELEGDCEFKLTRFQASQVARAVLARVRK